MPIQHQEVEGRAVVGVLLCCGNRVDGGGPLVKPEKLREYTLAGSADLHSEPVAGLTVAGNQRLSCGSDDSGRHQSVTVGHRVGHGDGVSTRAHRMDLGHRGITTPAKGRGTPRIIERREFVCIDRRIGEGGFATGLPIAGYHPQDTGGSRTVADLLIRAPVQPQPSNVNRQSCSPQQEHHRHRHHDQNGAPVGRRPLDHDSLS